MKRHILVISQHFYPEQFRINDLCVEWVKRGYRVTVITGIPNYPQGKFYTGYGPFKKRRENYGGVEIIRLPIFPRGKNHLTLSFNYLSFIVSGFFWNLFTRIKADYVFVFATSPIMQALPGIWYARKRRIPCYIYVQDLWPENFQAVTGISNKYIIGAIGKVVDYIYNQCTRIFVTSRSFVEAISNRGVPKEKIEYWPQYAEDFYKPLPKKGIREIPDDGAFNIIFAGNIGLAQGLDILPKAALILKDKLQGRQVRFNIVGDGRYKETLVNMVHSFGVSDMFNFIDKQPAMRIPEFLAACDAALICLTSNPIFTMTIPAKLQSYMACGVPILVSADGETAKIVSEANAGLCSPAGDVDSLAENIVRMVNMTSDELKRLGNNAREYYCKNFNKEELLDRVDRYFT